MKGAIKTKFPHQNKAKNLKPYRDTTIKSQTAHGKNAVPKPITTTTRIGVRMSRREDVFTSDCWKTTFL